MYEDVTKVDPEKLKALAAELQGKDHQELESAVLELLQMNVYLHKWLNNIKTEL